MYVVTRICTYSSIHFMPFCILRFSHPPTDLLHVNKSHPPSLPLSLSLNIIRVGGVVVGRRRGREIIGYSKV
jgi:hypothetical protein